MSTETLECSVCGESWTREVKRGRKPMYCPDCRESVETRVNQTCVKCSGSLSGRQRKYCSDECRPDRYVRQRGTCVECGDPLPLYHRKYCSDDCNPTIRSGPRGSICIACGSHFIANARGPISSYCSRSCYSRAKRAKPCVVCGDILPKNHSKYCSDECNPQVETNSTGRVCKFCWGHFISDKRECCSRECAGWYSQLGRGYGPSEYTCNWCGEKYETMRRGDGDKCCSRECGFKWLAHQQRVASQKDEMLSPPYAIPRFDGGPTKHTHALRMTFHWFTNECRWCAERFRSENVLERYCSDECRAHRVRFRAWDGPREFDCAECGEQVVTEQSDHRRVYCSDTCAKRASRRGRPNNHRQRARKYGVDYEPIRTSQVLERDGWKCGICGGRIWKHTKTPHPKSGTLDHIVPMSRGGDHVGTNVQAAHWECNVEKGNGSMGSQLRLVG